MEKIENDINSVVWCNDVCQADYVESTMIGVTNLKKRKLSQALQSQICHSLDYELLNEIYQSYAAVLHVYLQIRFRDDLD